MCDACCKSQFMMELLRHVFLEVLRSKICLQLWYFSQCKYLVTFYLHLSSPLVFHPPLVYIVNPLT